MFIKIKNKLVNKVEDSFYLVRDTPSLKITNKKIKPNEKGIKFIYNWNINETVNSTKMESLLNSEIVEKKEVLGNINLTNMLLFRDSINSGNAFKNVEKVKERVEKVKNTKEVVEVYPGVEIIKNAITEKEQLELFELLKPSILEQAGKTNKGKKANLMIGLGLRWDYKSNNSDNTFVNIPTTINNSTYQKNKYGYYKESLNNKPLNPISTRLKELMSIATGIDATNYDGAIVNIYDNKTFISAHNDVDESADAINYPVLVLNIGGEGNFSIEEGKTKNYNSKEYTENKLQAGDGYVFGKNGVNRDIFHRTTANNIKGILPELNINNENTTTNYSKGSYRISITLRRVMPLDSDMPNAPKLKKELEATINSKLLFKEIKDKWLASGRTENDWNSMTTEERNNEIDCL